MTGSPLSRRSSARTSRRFANIRQHRTGTFRAKRSVRCPARTVDPERRTIYAGLNYPGTVGYIGAIGLDDGRVEHLQDIKQPRIYTVTSLAYDPGDQHVVLHRRQHRLPRPDRARCHDQTAANAAQGRAHRRAVVQRVGSVAMGHPHVQRHLHAGPDSRALHDWNAIYSWPYGEVAYDLDVSPDGQLVAVSVGEISGKQTVRVMRTASLAMNDPTPIKQFDFGTAIPSNFVFSPDSGYLFGSSYYTGVSNIFRYEIATGEIEALTNAETGFFRPDSARQRIAAGIPVHR